MTSQVCLLCDETKHVYLFTLADGARLMQCAGCELATRADSGGSLQDPSVYKAVRSTEEHAADKYIAHLRRRGISSGRLLFIALPGEEIINSYLGRNGFSVTKLTEDELSADVDRLTPESFDCAIVYQALERAENPKLLLENIHRLLSSQGQIVIVGINLDSWPARYFGHRWIGWGLGLNYFFSRMTMHLFLEKCGFNQILISPDQRFYTLEHVSSQTERIPGKYKRAAAGAFFSLIPSAVLQKQVQISSSALVFSAGKTSLKPLTKLSIVLPVFNEKATFLELFHQLRGKTFEGIDEVEILIVESNSTDGTREVVESITDPGVRIILEQRPSGKGHAVREGFKNATGDIIVIQDADLEYDVDDYDVLLQPLLNYRRPFVLGTRHKGDWKIRKFTEQAFLAFILNTGHMFFVWLLNTLYQQSMTDPFTMFKVVRRDCLYGLKFECNRFDFDHELVIKLILKGYVPLEIPVNYKSRSFAEGKKTSFLRDPYTWIIANFKYRFASPYDEAIVSPMNVEPLRVK